MTIEDATKLLSERWHGCHDAFGLLSALQEMGVIKFDKTPDDIRTREVLMSIFEEYDSLKHLRGPSAFVYMLEQAGYKIVKK